MVVETELVSKPYVPEPIEGNPADNLSDEELIKQIQQAQSELINQQNQPTVEPTTSPVTKPVAQSGEQVVEKKEEQPQEQVPVQVVQQLEPSVQPTFEELKAKKHIQTPEELAKIYAALERDYSRKSQELAKRQETTQPIPTEQPLAYEEYSQRFKEDYENDPLGTMAKLVQVLNQPLLEKQKESDLEREVLRLSGSPNTADFNLPEMQEEMQKVVNERPFMKGNLSVHLQDAYWIAKGRLSSKTRQEAVEQGKKIAEEDIKNKKTAVVETSARATPPEPFNPETASLDDLKKVILYHQQQLKR